MNKQLISKEMLYFIGTIGSSSFNFIVMLLLINFDSSSYLEYTLFIGITVFVFPIISFGVTSLMQKDIFEKHSYLLLYLFSPIMCLVFSLFSTIDNLSSAIMLNILNITAIYLKSKDKAFSFAIAKNIPLIGFIIFTFYGLSIIDSFLYSFYFAIPYITLLLIRERKYKINPKQYLNVLKNSIKVGIGSYVQGSVVIIEKKLALLLPQELAILFNFTMDICSSVKMIKAPFLYTWQIAYFRDNIDHIKILLKKNIVANILISFSFLLFLVLTSKGFIIEFLLLFNFFSLLDLLKDYSYNLWIHYDLNFALVSNLFYAGLSLMIYFIVFNNIYFIFIARMFINFIYWISTKFYIKRSTID